MAKQKSFDECYKDMAETANVTPHDLRNALNMLAKYRRWMDEDHQKKFSEYRAARTVIPAFTRAFEKADASILKNALAENGINLGTKSENKLADLITHRKNTRDKLKQYGVKLHKTKMKKLINQTTGLPYANNNDEDKIQLTQKEMDGLKAAGFDEKTEIPRLFVLKK